VVAGAAESGGRDQGRGVRGVGFALPALSSGGLGSRVVTLAIGTVNTLVR